MHLKSLSLIFIRPVLLTPALLTPVLLFANSLPGSYSSSSWTPVISLFAGAGNIHASSQSQTSTGDDNELFIYNSTSENKMVGLGGVFIGAQHDLSSQFFIQTGLEYSYLGSRNIPGSNTTGNDPESSTPYSYQYKFQTQQLLALAKLLTQINLLNTEHCLYPYVSLGLGAAFNTSHDFSSSTQESGSVNLTPGFDSHTNINFSYSVGLGFETNLSKNMRAGLGYEFVHFGKSALGQGSVTMNDYSAPTNFNLAGPKTYANEVKAQISYLF